MVDDVVEKDTRFHPENPLEIAWMSHEDENPNKKSFHRLDKSHLKKLEGKDPIFLAEFSRGGGGACKYVFHKTRDLGGQLFMVYKHVHQKTPLAGILVHSHQPVIRLEREYHWRGDGEVICVVWNFAASGNYAFSRFFYANDPCYQGNLRYIPQSYPPPQQIRPY